MNTEKYANITNKTVAVIFGGISGEHEVSIVSASSIISLLKNRGYNVLPVGITREGRWLVSGDPLEILRSGGNGNAGERAFLSTDPDIKGLVCLKQNTSGEYIFDKIINIDVIFPVLHGTYGEDGVIQGLFELSGIPYVGCKVTSSACCMDKIVMKRLFASAGLKVVEDVYFNRNKWNKSKESIISDCEKLGYPLFIKPANTGSSVGISKARNTAELIEAVEKAAKYDFRIQVERAVANPREIEVAVLGNSEPIASIPGEIVPSNEFYDYEAKYESGKSDTIIPAELSEKVQEEIRAKAKEAYITMGCEGLARVDFIMDRATEDVYINEINTLPGFTSISMYPMLWEATGIPSEELMDRLILLAADSYEEKLKNSVMSPVRTSWYKQPLKIN